MGRPPPGLPRRTRDETFYPKAASGAGTGREACAIELMSWNPCCQAGGTLIRRVSGFRLRIGDRSRNFEHARMAWRADEVAWPGN